MFFGVMIMKTMVRGIALFTAIFAFGLVANAQINYGAEVNIPFEFSIGERGYEAGRYTVKIDKQMVAGAVLTIQRIGSDEFQSVMLSNYGGERSNDVELIFSLVDGRRYLTNITTSNSDYALLTKGGRNRKLARVKVSAAARTSSL
jgi:hypothetical protein